MCMCRHLTIGSFLLIKLRGRKDGLRVAVATQVRTGSGVAMHPMQKDLEVANMLRSRLQGFGGAVVPPHLPSHDIINFLQQVATGAPAAPTAKAPHAAGPVPTTVPPTAAPAKAAPARAEADPWRSHAPWHQTTEGWGNNGSPGPTFSKAAPVAPPGTVAAAATAEGSQGQEDLAQALSSHLQNPSAARPSAELLQALARVAKMEDEEPPKPPPFDSWDAAVTTEAPPGPPEMPPAAVSSARQLNHEPPPPLPDTDPTGPATAGAAGANALRGGAALQHLTRNAVTAAGGSSEAQAAAKAAVEHLMRSIPVLREMRDGPGEDGGSPDGEVPGQARVVGSAAAGPETCTFQYDITPNDDAEATFRTIRRRIELEMSDGCVVQICLQMVRRPR